MECPRNKTTWNKAALRKKCSSFPQNCTQPEQFVYHCVINHPINKKVEVCARKRIISADPECYDLVAHESTLLTQSQVSVSSDLPTTSSNIFENEDDGSGTMQEEGKALIAALVTGIIGVLLAVLAGALIIMLKKSRKKRQEAIKLTVKKEEKKDSNDSALQQLEDTTFMQSALLSC